jgi:hypothetical protein
LQKNHEAYKISKNQQREMNGNLESCDRYDHYGNKSADGRAYRNFLSFHTTFGNNRHNIGRGASGDGVSAPEKKHPLHSRVLLFMCALTHLIAMSASAAAETAVATRGYVDGGLATKQDKLTAGTGLSIVGNVISALAGSVDWASISSRPTTLAGYGITDAATAAQGAKAGTSVQLTGSQTITGPKIFNPTSAADANSPLVIGSANGKNFSYNEGIRIMRFTSDGADSSGTVWSGILLGAKRGDFASAVDPAGYDAATPSPTGLLGNATWWLASNPNGDFIVSQSAPSQYSSSINGLYIKRTGEMYYGNNAEGPVAANQIARQKDLPAMRKNNMLNYINKCTIAESGRFSSIATAANVGSYVYSDGFEVSFNFVIGIVGGTAVGSGSDILTLPAGVRPAATVYFPATTYWRGEDTNISMYGGDVGIKPDGRVFLDSRISQNPYGTSYSGYLFFNGKFYTEAIPNAP